MFKTLNNILISLPSKLRAFTYESLFTKGEGHVLKGTNCHGKQLFLENMENEGAFRWLLFLRLSILLLGLLTNPLRDSIPAQLMRVFEFIGIPLVIYNLILLVFHKRIARVLSDFPIVQYVDLAFSCGIICLGSGWRSTYLGYTISSIILCTIFDKSRGAWVSCILLSAVDLLVDPLSGYSAHSFDLPTRDLRTGMVIFYIMSGALFGYFSKAIERLHELKQEKLDEIEKSAIMAHKIAVAHDLHDGIRAKMTAILLIARGLVDKHRLFDSAVQSELLKLWRWLNYMQTELSNFVDSLQTPSALEKAQTFDLVSLLQQETKIIEDMTGFVWNVQALPTEIYYSIDHKHNFLNFCSEAMTNAWRHSGVCKGTVNISEKDDKIVIEIADEGKGFDRSRQKNGNSLGMKSLAKRAHDLTADYSITSEPGKGCTTSLLLDIPVLEDSEATSILPAR